MISRKTIHFLLYCTLYTAIISCSQNGIDEVKVLARVNDYQILLDEFQFQLAEEMELDGDLKLTKDEKKKFLDRLIKKELLIQEAKRIKLDRSEEFIQTIERYWESTLIRNLLEIKGRKISRRVLISQEEIEAYYQDMKKAGIEVSSLAEIETDIKNSLKEEKKSRLLKAWLDELQASATVEINQELLYKN